MRLPDGYLSGSCGEIRFVLHRSFVPLAKEICSVLESLEGGKVREDVSVFTKGRGNVYLWEKGEERFVLRPYRHGGVLGKILGRRFLRPERFLREVEITELARSRGITCLQPVGVAYYGTLFGIKGFLMSRWLPRSTTLEAWMRGHRPTLYVIKMVAKAIAEMHRAGIEHRDLNIQNLLLVEGCDGRLTLSLIDFDRANFVSRMSLKKGMRQLRRLDRSFLKWIPEESPWQSSWTRMRFAVAYCRVVPEMRPLMMAYLRHVKWYERRYRWGWAIRRVPRSH